MLLLLLVPTRKKNLVEGLLVENDAGDVLVEVGSGEEELAVLPAVRLIVLEVDGGEALANGACKGSILSRKTQSYQFWHNGGDENNHTIEKLR